MEQVVILGGGVAGMQTAAALSDLGIKSVIIEKQSELGGKVKTYDKIFPFFQSGKEIVKYLESKLQSSSLINIKTGTEISSVTGSAPDFQVRLTADSQRIPAQAIVVATGFEPFDASLQEEYGYSVYPNVITATEMEHMLDFESDTHGELTRPSDGKPAKRVAMIFCAGSRSEKLGHNYCSRICCSFTIKQAIEIKERRPDAWVTCFYIDIRTYGRGFEEMYRKAQELGIKFIRGRVAECGMLPNGDITLKAEDTIQGKPIRGTFDLVSLSTGMTPCVDAVKLMRILGIRVDEDGFFTSIDTETQPNISSREGIFLAGAVTGLKPIPDCISDGNAVAAKVAGFIKTQVVPQGFV